MAVTQPAGDPITPSDGVAVIGLGRMGLPMARNLCAAGYRVTGYDPSPACRDRAAGAGVQVTASAAEAAVTTAAALIVVGFDEQAVEVISEPSRGVLASARPGYVIAMCSTVQISTSARMAELARRVGVGLIDATLCLGEPAAEDASLLILCGGPAETVNRLAPALSVVGRHIYRLGDVGAGQIGKMLNNYLLWNSVVANHEALRLGGRLGLDLEALRQSLMRSSGDNWALGTWRRSRPMPWAEKDMRILLSHAERAGVGMPNAAVVQEQIHRIKLVKNAWCDGEGNAASMDDFTRAHL
jgi:3-hydroxyisobutyrate dehydrogenase-like beta-hydroxyacid dehydrogenase